MALGLCVLLLLAFAAIGLVVERVMTRSLMSAELEFATSTARLLENGEWDAADIDAIAREHSTRGLRWVSPERTQVVGTLNGISVEKDGARTLEIDGSLYVAVRRVRRNDITIVVPSTRVADRIEETRRLVWTFFGFEAIVILAFAYAFLTFLVVRPLRAIRVATQRASSGDLASPIERVPRNEFGDLAASFNAMLARLEEQREELETRLVELKETNTELRQTRDSLVRSEKLASVGQLAAGIAHEVGNPLAAISGYNEIMMDELDAADRQDMLVRTGVQLERIRTIIRSLLDFSRDEGEVQVEPTDLDPIVTEAIRLVESLPRARAIQFVNEIPDDLPPVRSASARLSQVLVNLLVNAADAIKGAECEQERVIIHADYDAQTVRLSIQDTGPGVPDAVAAKIFDPFFTTKDPGEGTGLGLSISLRIIEELGGGLDVSSNAQGACFTITLPRAV